MTVRACSITHVAASMHHCEGMQHHTSCRRQHSQSQTGQAGGRRPRHAQTDHLTSMLDSTLQVVAGWGRADPPWRPGAKCDTHNFPAARVQLQLAQHCDSFSQCVLHSARTPVRVVATGQRCSRKWKQRRRRTGSLMRHPLPSWGRLCAAMPSQKVFLDAACSKWWPRQSRQWKVYRGLGEDQ